MAAVAAEEERRKAEKPQCDESQARRIARSLFGVTGISSISELDSYDDVNFRVKGTLGGEDLTLTLKIHNGVESDNAAVLQAQDEAMLFLHGKGFAVPYPLRPAKKTDELCVAGTGDGPVKRPLVVRILAWVQGRTMNSTGCTLALAEEAGEFLGRLSSDLDRFDHPGAHRVQKIAR